MSHENETISKLFLELSQFTDAKTEREIALEERIQQIAEALEQIVCTEGEDAGVVLLSNEGPTHYSEALKCEVYDHDYFSPLGDALIAAWKLTQPESENSNTR